MINAQNVTKSYISPTGEMRVLAGISFKVTPGEVLCLVGPTGCGKTTLFNILAGTDEPSSGAVAKDAGLRIRYVPQRDSLLPWRSAALNLVFGLEVGGFLDTHAVTQLLRSARRFGLGDSLTSYPRQISGGMRQTVAFLRSNAIPTDVLLLDEPFSATDSRLKAMLEDELLCRVRADNIAAIFITHDLDEAIAIASRIVVLSARPATVVADLVLSPTPPINSRERRERNAFAFERAQIWKILHEATFR